jgi:putative transposase
MARKRYSAEEIIGYLRQAEVFAGAGCWLGGGSAQAGCDEQYVISVAQGIWRVGLDQARRLKELEQENSRLKRAVANLTLDNLILKEVSTGKF